MQNFIIIEQISRQKYTYLKINISLIYIYYFIYQSNKWNFVNINIYYINIIFQNRVNITKKYIILGFIFIQIQIRIFTNLHKLQICFYKSKLLFKKINKNIILKQLYKFKQRYYLRTLIFFEQNYPKILNFKFLFFIQIYIDVNLCSSKKKFLLPILQRFKFRFKTSLEKEIFMNIIDLQYSTFYFTRIIFIIYQRQIKFSCFIIQIEYMQYLSEKENHFVYDKYIFLRKLNQFQIQTNP
eukprot:TRINITY_DN5258_c0_g1_i1.p1 TRINITY_DN5258_c0_g1~~TRINITY_DN5258_c0_g1_i1.p1  ORF type:complete len:240 (-),score=-21.18 TRINITY_DN5258_c0_g1_i1:487-1206(-)